MLTTRPILRLQSVFSQRWFPYAAITISLAVLAGLFLYPSSWEFPMDDTYIHFVYAENLAQYGQLFFNQPNEAGVGTTSLTWVMLLAGAARSGIPLHLAAKIFGFIALVTAAWGIFALFRLILGPLPAFALTLLVSASGHFVWFALSGMETILFLMLGILSLLLYRQQRWVGLGLALGALALTRPDGLALAGAIGLFEIWINRRDLRRFPRGLIAAGLICLLVCGPWFGYLLYRTGDLLPTSAMGKQTSSLIGMRLIASHSPWLAWLARFPAILYVGTWVMYLLTFVLGGMALPGPELLLGSEIGNANYSIAYTAILGWVLIIAPLLAASRHRLAAVLWNGNLKNLTFRPMWVFAVWLVLHNLAYGFFLPVPGTASRYGTINHVALWLALVLGLLHFIPYRGRFRLLAAGLVVIACANTLYWNRVYDANLEHMQNVRIAAANYLDEYIDPDTPVAAFDVGAVRYFSQRSIIDLGGMIDPALGEVYRTDGRIDRYLDMHNVRYVVLPGRTGTTKEGWFDFAKEMGLTDSPMFSLAQIHVFEISHERWLLGYLPTNNYQASVTVYRLR